MQEFLVMVAAQVVAGLIVQFVLSRINNKTA